MGYIRKTYRDVRKIRLIVGITGATGAIFGIRTLEALKEFGVETHLIIST